MDDIWVCAPVLGRYYVVAITMDERYLDRQLSVGAFDICDRTKTWWRKCATSADGINILAQGFLC